MSCLKYSLEGNSTAVHRGPVQVATIKRSPLGRSLTIHPKIGESFTTREMDNLLGYMTALEPRK